MRGTIDRKPTYQLRPLNVKFDRFGIVECAPGSCRWNLRSHIAQRSRDNPAVRLYEQFGFEIVSDNQESLTMMKELGVTIRRVG